MMIRAGATWIAVAALTFWPGHADAIGPTGIDEAIQVLADLTAIDVDCHDLAVNFGVGFRFAAEQGLSPVAILPAGARRPAFETALRKSLSGYGDEIVCGALAHHYSVALPGSVTFGPPARDGS